MLYVYINNNKILYEAAKIQNLKYVNNFKNTWHLNACKRNLYIDKMMGLHLRSLSESECNLAGNEVWNRFMN